MTTCKSIGVICLDYNDFNHYIDYYLRDCKVLRKTKTTRKIENMLFVAVSSVKFGFTGSTYHYYLFTDHACENNDLIEIIKFTRIGTCQHPTNIII